MNAPRVASLSRADRALLDRVNRTGARFPETRTVHEIIERAAARRTDAYAVRCDHAASLNAPAITRGQLDHRANQLAHRLRAEGVGPGSIVALTTERSVAMMIGILGILKAGAAYMPAPPDAPPDRLRYMLENADVRVLVADRRAAAPECFAGRVIGLDDPSVLAGDATRPVVPMRSRELAYVIYTSGSTGRPKGVMVEHRALVNRLHWMQQTYPIGPGDVVLQKTPYSFDVSVWELLWWAMYGAHLCMLVPGGERNPVAIAAAIRKHRATIVHFVPSMLNVFLEYLGVKSGRARDVMGSVRRVFASGEALTPSHVRKFNEIIGRETATQLTNLYGPTEAAIDVSYYDCPARGDVDVVPIGRPIHNTRLHVLHDGREAGVGEPGELCIGGVALARGYVNNATLTAERFVQNPVDPGERIYRTGDMARWRPDGMLEYLGREDHQIKIRGMRVELGEIENTVREFDGVVDCVAVVERLA